MAQLNGTFDSSQHEDIGGAFDPIPAGEYMMQIVESAILETKARNGKYIKLTLKVIDGEYKGRQIWVNLNIVNPNPVAVEIATKELATICRAVGKLQIVDTQELHGIPFLGRVKIRPASGDYPPSNDMVGYKPLGVGAVAPAFASAPEQTEVNAAPAAPPEPTNKVPWA
jgi:hypothetical protein